MNDNEFYEVLKSKLDEIVCEKKKTNSRLLVIELLILLAVIVRGIFLISSF